MPPTYVADRATVRLRLDASKYDEPFARFVLAEQRAGRAWKVEELLATSYLRRNGPASRATLAKAVQATEEEAQELINNLLGDVVDRFGSGPGTRYALSARVQGALGSEATYTRERGLAREAQRSIVMQHAVKFGRIDNETVRKLVEVSVAEATNLLRTLESRGLLVQQGKRRWAYYEPAPRSAPVGRRQVAAQLPLNLRGTVGGRQRGE